MATVTLKRVRIVLWSLVVLAAIGATALFLLAPPRNPQTSSLGGGTYSLIDHNGQPVDQSMLIGQPSLIFFGFTNCPDVCPTTLGEMAAWFEALGPDAKNLKAFFVSIDPERDTPEAMKGYATWASDRVTGVTGSLEEITKMAKAWGVFFEKVPVDGGDYTMSHTASTFLVNSQGEFEGTIAYEENQETAIAKIRKLVAEN